MLNQNILPRVSVLISTKNRPKLIHRAIDSILAQSLQNFELIIVDVSDNNLTQQVVTAYNDHRIVYTKVDNEISAAKTVNNALSPAKGEYLAFCDDDDEWCSIEKLTKQVALIDSLGEDYGFVSCGWEIWNDATNQHISYDMPKARGYVFPQMLVSNVSLGTPTLLIRKTAYFAVGGFEEKVRYSADYLLLTKLSKEFKFDYVPEILVLGHQFHAFGSSQYLVNRDFNFRDKMDYFAFFLENFEVDYRNYPMAKKKMLENVITMASKASDIRSFCLFSIKYVQERHGCRFVVKRVLLLIRFGAINIWRSVFRKIECVIIKRKA